MSKEQLQLFTAEDNEQIVQELPVKKNSKAARSFVKEIAQSEVLEIFNLWRETFHPARKNSVKLTEKRYARIAAAIATYGVRTCQLAIVGCSFSDWHMGQNPQGVRYTDIALIFRSHEHVERFVGLALGRDSAAREFLGNE